MNLPVRPALGLLIASAVIPAAALLGGVESGLGVGKFLPAYEPTHVAGPDKGTDTCPVCRYGMRPAVQVWVNNDSPANVAKIATALQELAEANTAKELKGFVVFTNAQKKAEAELAKSVTQFAVANKIKDIAVTYLADQKAQAISDYKINLSPAIKNTIFVYKNRQVATKFVNLEATDAGLKHLKAAVQGVLK